MHMQKFWGLLKDIIIAILKELFAFGANVCLQNLVYINFLYRILTESHQKMYKPFWKGLNNTAEINH